MFVWERVWGSMTICGPAYESLSKVPSFSSCQSQHPDILVLHLSPPRSVTSDPTPWPFLTHQMDICLAGLRESGLHGKTIHGCFYRFLWSASPLHIERKRKISWLTCTFIAEWERKAGKGKELFVCNVNLIFSNLAMAEMDSKALNGPCLVVPANFQSQIQGHCLCSWPVRPELERLRVQTWSQANQAGRG